MREVRVNDGLLYGMDERASQPTLEGVLGWSWALARSTCTPATLILGVGVVVTWLAFITWTGAGPAGWQAQLCATLDQGPRSCREINRGKDESRIVPHGAALGHSS